MTLSRRSFLRRSAAVGVAGLAGAELASCGGEDRPDAAGASGDAGLQRRVAFDGRHQAGVISAPSGEATFVALDAIAPDTAALAQALQQLSAHARALTEGYRFAQRDRGTPPPDSGTLGTAVDPDGLTITIGFGASLFDTRFGLAGKRPDGLTRMRRFPNDDIDEDRAHGDVLVTLNAARRDTVVHAMRELLRPVRGALAVRWTLDGFLSSDRGPAARSARRNLFGFRDGTSNPSGAQRDRLLWLGPNAGWAAGGTFQVVRTIRMHVEFPVGGGYYFVPRGATGPTDRVGSGLLS
jgi:deferrochelatase/peroxidase EfeB